MFLILILISVLIIYWWSWRKRLMSVLKRNGIPGPEPHLIYGNFNEYNSKGYAKCWEDWILKYGRIVGYYLGGKPFVLIADPDLLKLIQIKDFKHFVKRPLTVAGGNNPNNRLQQHLLVMDGNKWKSMRSALTPSFSGAKLKQMTPIMSSSIDNFIKNISKNADEGKEIEIFERLQGFALDAISKAAFGVETGVQDNLDDPFLRAIQGTFTLGFGKTLITLWFCFPELRFIINPLRKIAEFIADSMGKSHHGYVLKVCDSIIGKRRKNPLVGRKDLLQLMLDAKSTEVLSFDKLEISSNMNQDSINENMVQSGKKVSVLSNDEIASNAIIFIGGNESTSSALGFIMHILVNYNDIQEKMREEVKQLMESDGKLDYNTVTKLSFMEQVIYETLRIYPPVIKNISRAPDIDYHYKDIIIPKGTDCRVAVYFLHRDPQFWVDPEKFDPDRFSAENKHLINPVVWQPFGCGPRNCVGIRFAMLEMKLLLARLLIKYKFVASQNTELGDIQREFKLATMNPKHGVYLKAVPIS